MDPIFFFPSTRHGSGQDTSPHTAPAGGSRQSVCGKEHGECVERAWRKCAKCMENVCKVHGQCVEKHGESVERVAMDSACRVHRENMENPWTFYGVYKESL